MDIPSSTKKLQDMKALIDDQLSPIKADPNENPNGFSLKMQPVSDMIKPRGRAAMKVRSDSMDEDSEFPSPVRNAPPKFDPQSPESKYKS